MRGGLAGRLLRLDDPNADEDLGAEVVVVGQRALVTARELEVLKLVARGLSNRQISESLFLSDATVKTHLAHVYAKLSVRDRVQAEVLAYGTGLVPPGTRKP